MNRYINRDISVATLLRSLATGIVIASLISIALILAFKYGSPRGFGRGISGKMSWDGIRANIPLLISLWLISFIIYFVLDLFSGNKKIFYICPNCQHAVQDSINKKISCMSCKVQLEPLDGFYSRHKNIEYIPDESNVNRETAARSQSFYTNLNAHLFAPREITGTKMNSDLAFFLSVLPALIFIFIYATLPPEDLSMVPFIIILVNISCIISGIAIYAYRRCMLVNIARNNNDLNIIFTLSLFKPFESNITEDTNEAIRSCAQSVVAAYRFVSYSVIMFFMIFPFTLLLILVVPPMLN